MDSEKLAKVLAMVESEHQGEALSALRAARIMLSRAGLTFRDLVTGGLPAKAASEPVATPPPQAPPPDYPPPPDQIVQGLRRQVSDLEREISTLRRALDKAQGEADRQRDEAGRWRVLARETAEKLWDLGQALERRHTRSAPNDRRQAVVELLQDPDSTLLSDREIARRVGTSCQVVAHWRRRLAIVGRKLHLLPVQARGRGLWGVFLSRRYPTAAHADTERRHHWLGFAAERLMSGPGAPRDRGPRRY